MNINKRRARMWAFGLFLVLMAGCSFSRWQTVETQNLIIHYKKGSFAEKDIEEAKKRYEFSINKVLQTVPNAQKTPKVKVFLYEELGSKGYAEVTDREVHFLYSDVFRLTSAHEFFHIFLYELNPNAPIRFEEGFCRKAEGKAKRFKGTLYKIMYYQLVKLTTPDRWNVAEVFVNNYKDDDEGNIASAFVLYAEKKLGQQQFWQFYRELNQNNYEQLLVKYFSMSIDQINAEFKSFVQTIPDPPEAFKFKYSPETASMHY